MKAEYLKTAKMILEQNGDCSRTPISCGECPAESIHEPCTSGTDKKIEWFKNYIAANEETEQIRMTKEQARLLCYYCLPAGIMDDVIKKMEQHGYIKKSIVDEAEELIKNWLNGHDVEVDLMVSKALAAMEFLKAENLKLKTLDK